MTMLAQNFPGRIATVREIASDERLPEKFLEPILLDLKNAGKKAGMIESLRDAAPRISDRTSLADFCCSRNN